MATLWAEGFDNETGASDIINGVLDYISDPTHFSLTTGAAFGGKAVALTSTGTGVSCYTSKTVAATVQGYTANNVYLAAPSGGGDYNLFWAFYDIASSAAQITVAIDAGSGTIFAFLGYGPFTGPGTSGLTNLAIASSSAGVVPTGSWTSVEVGLKIDPASGFVIVKVNGATVINLAGIVTQVSDNSSFSAVQHGVCVASGGSSAAGLFDDYYIGDATGSSQNSFIGPGNILTRFMTSNNAVAFTPLAESNWNEISETAMDGDASYNFSSAVNATDTFNSATAVPAGYVVDFVKVQQASRIASAGSRQACNVLYSGSTQAFGANHAKGTTYTYQEDYYPNDPATSAPWSNAAVLASQPGYKITV